MFMLQKFWVNLNLFLFEFSDTNLGDPSDWVDSHFIDKIQEPLTVFCSAMAGILAFKVLIMR